MPRFVKKPVEIEARQVPLSPGTLSNITEFLDETIALAEWCRGRSYMMTMPDEYAWDHEVTGGPAPLVKGPYIHIPTLEGDHAAIPGDWIICGVQGEFYPCKPDIFDKTYDPVDELSRQICPTCDRPCDDHDDDCAAVA